MEEKYKEVLAKWLKSTIESEYNLIRPGEVEVTSDELVIVANDLLGTDWDSVASLFAYLLRSYEFNIEVVNHDPFFIVTLVCLVSAVSATCSKQSTFIHNILAMDQDNQTLLMELIQGTSLNKKVISDDRNDASNINEISNIVCDKCEHQEVFIEQLKRQVFDNTHQLKESERKYKSEIADYMNKLVDTEVEILNKDNQVRQLTDTVDKLNLKIQELEDKLKLSTDATEQVIVLQDKVDILIPQIEKMEQLESQLTRLRMKYDECKDIKMQLKNECAAHIETHNKLMVVENELENTRKYKPLVDEYRNKNVEISIEIDTLKMTIQQKDEEIHRMKSMYQSTQDSDSNMITQVYRLTEELQEAHQKIRLLECQEGVGHTMTELNPAVMNELTALRTQNQELHLKLDQSSLESLDKLTNTNEELRCQNQNITQKWMTTTEALKQANEIIVIKDRTIDTMEVQMLELNQRINDNEHVANEDKLALSYRYEEFIHTMQLQHDHDYTHMMNDKNGIIIEKENIITQQTQTIHNKDMEIQVLTEECHDKECNIQQLNAMIIRGKQHIQETVTNHKRTLDMMEEEYNQNIEKEECKYRVLLVDIEEEKTKRRRIEREKKLLEAEIHRQKTQLHMTSNTSVHEVDTALKEFKTMQIQLEEAYNELNYLRTKYGVTESTEGVVGGDTCTSVSSVLSSEQKHGSKEDTMNKVKSSSSSLSSSSLKSHATRMKGPTRAISSTTNTTTTTTTSSSNINRMDHTNSNTNTAHKSFESGILQQHELSERKLETMQKEKREMIARNLEENKEKIELSQKLLSTEKELTSLKAKVTKLTLDNERLQRKLSNPISNDVCMKQKTQSMMVEEDKENIIN